MTVLLRSAWRWLLPKLKWIVLALVALFTLGMLAKRRRSRSRPLTPGDATALADALRPGIERRADVAHKEALEHKRFAEQRIREAEEEKKRVASMTAADVLKESEDYARRVRARGGPLLVLLAALSFPRVTAAQEILPFQLAQPMTGAAGWWIPDDIWRAALGDAKELDELRAALPGFRSALDAKDRELAALRRSVELEQALARLSEVKLESANEELAQAERWYRSPRFLVPLGIVLGAAVVAVPLVLAR